MKANQFYVLVTGISTFQWRAVVQTGFAAEVMEDNTSDCRTHVLGIN